MTSPWPSPLVVSTDNFPPPYNLTQRTREEVKFGLAAIAETFGSAKTWLFHPSLQHPETKAKLKASCINCDNLDDDERDWQGRVIGRGLYGSLNALRTRVKHKCKPFMDPGPLITLLTVCTKCSESVGRYQEVVQIKQIFGFKGNKKISSGMVLRISYQEIEEIVSSKVIVMERGPLNMDTIKIFSRDGNWRRWYLWS